MKTAVIPITILVLLSFFLSSIVTGYALERARDKRGASDHHIKEVLHIFYEYPFEGMLKHEYRDLPRLNGADSITFFGEDGVKIIITFEEVQ